MAEQAAASLMVDTCTQRGQEASLDKEHLVGKCEVINDSLRIAELLNKDVLDKKRDTT